MSKESEHKWHDKDAAFKDYPTDLKSEWMAVPPATAINHVAISTAEVQRIKLISSVTRILLEAIDAEMQSDFPQLSDEILEKVADLKRVMGGEG